MWLKRNLIECTTIVSCGGTFLGVLLNYLTKISPITGIWFPLYILTLFIVSLCVSIKFIQWLLRLNRPLQYDLDRFIEDYPYLSFLSRVLPRTRRPKLTECREYDTNELSIISTVLERRLVSSWYLPYISQEIGFPFACKQMLDQIIGKAFQLTNKIESKDVFIDICTTLTSHLKEYQKAVKRHEKSPTNSIESLYKKSHPIYDSTNKKLQSADHCTNILRVVFKELIPWELWDTPHSELLVRILSKKLDNFIDSTLAEPAWLNDKLLTILKGKPEPVTPKPTKVSKPVFTEKPIFEENKELPNVGSELSSVMTEDTASVWHRKINDNLMEVESIVESMQNVSEEVPSTDTLAVDIKTSPVMRQKRGRQGRNEVKIYDRVIEGSVKTWETDIDLQCISLGQDLLASLDGEITLSRLWGQDADAEGSPNPPRSKSPQPLWFGEEETIEVDPLDASLFKESKKEHSPKPAELLKDLQSTVSQAKHKIGDLQVEAKVLDVPRKQSSDEAAGMMEGLLDFGIAGLKKGLRFTGLSDDSQDKSPSHQRSDKSPPPDVSREKPMPEYKEVHTVNTQRDDNSSVPPLLKQQRVISQDSVPSIAKSVVKSEPVLMPLVDSPEPEYEEAADLSTSIAKLRCLLQQRAETSPRNEDIWWESAEETRGRTQHHHSSRPVDTATLADEYDMHLERNSSPGQTSNNMQRLDKLFHRTVTGVFNSIKTAVGAENEQGPRPNDPIDPRDLPDLYDWTYVCTSVELSVGGAVARLVGSRRAYTHVEAALDSLAHLAQPPTPRDVTPEDFDEWCCSLGPGWCGACAVLAAAELATSHVTHRLATLLFADLAESLLESWLAELAAWGRRQVFAIFEHMSERDDTSFTSTAVNRPLDVDETCQALLEKAPALFNVFGEETVSATTRLLVSSFTHKEVNKDVIFRSLDLLAGHFKKAAGLRNPSFDSN